MSAGYREHLPPPPLRPVVACTWEQETVAEHAQPVIPDGCVDLIWMGDGRLIVAGADTRPRIEALPAGRRLSGIRFRPGAAGAVLGLPASELRDRQVPAPLIWGEQATDLAEKIGGATPPQRLELLTAAVARRRPEPDPLVVAAAARLGLPGARVANVASELGVGERRLHRRTLAAVGYGPKMLARVARLRRLVALDGDSLARRALDAGYASQSHMSDEVCRLTGSTPVRFLEDAAHTAA